MKIWPFWKYWYFTRSQRWGIISILLLAFATLLVREPIANVLRTRHQQKMQPINERKFNELRQQLAAAEVAKQEAWTKEKAAKAASQERPKTSTTYKQQKPYAPKRIDINTAGVEDWKAFKGIGETLSNRIVKYREKLGGFHATRQVAEVYGISDSLFQSIQPFLSVSNSKVEKLKVNEADSLTLMNHPYISKTLAKQIVSYRVRIKPYSEPADLLKLYSMNDSLLNKLLPYLSFEAGQ
jgi:competence ComEA-like helix-hairpin-helix protein